MIDIEAAFTAYVQCALWSSSDYPPGVDPEDNPDAREVHLDAWDGEIADESLAEMRRVLKPGGRFYCDNVDLASPAGWAVFNRLATPATRPRNVLSIPEQALKSRRNWRRPFAISSSRAVFSGAQLLAEARPWIRITTGSVSVLTRKGEVMRGAR